MSCLDAKGACDTVSRLAAKQRVYLERPTANSLRGCCTMIWLTCQQAIEAFHTARDSRSQDEAIISSMKTVSFQCPAASASVEQREERPC
jgi:hypothetical protein